MVRSSEKWLDFMPKGTNKGTALKLILECESVSREECMGFGDNDNDVEMMKQMKYSYGMRSGSELPMVKVLSSAFMVRVP